MTLTHTDLNSRQLLQSTQLQESQYFNAAKHSQYLRGDQTRYEVSIYNFKHRDFLQLQWLRFTSGDIVDCLGFAVDEGLEKGSVEGGVDTLTFSTIGDDSLGRRLTFLGGRELFSFEGASRIFSDFTEDFGGRLDREFLTSLLHFDWERDFFRFGESFSISKAVVSGLRGVPSKRGV